MISCPRMFKIDSRLGTSSGKDGLKIKVASGGTLLSAAIAARDAMIMQSGDNIQRQEKLGQIHCIYHVVGKERAL
jgi:hypothetical protein